MIKHHVLATLKEPTEENFNIVSQIMLSAKDAVPSVKAAYISRDILHTPMSFDLVLILEFDDPEGLKTFIDHPHHKDYMVKESDKYVKEIRLIDIIAE